MSIAHESSSRNLVSASGPRPDQTSHLNPPDGKPEGGSFSGSDAVEEIEEIEDDERVSDFEKDDLDDEDDNDDDDDENAHAVVAVSISRVQTRLTSPQTPAAEKAQAFDREFEDFPFNGSDDLSLQSTSVSSSTPTPGEDANRTNFVDSFESSSFSKSAQSTELHAVDGACGGRHASRLPNRSRAETGPEKRSKKVGPFSIPRPFDTSRLSISSLGAWLSNSDSGSTSPTKAKRNSASFFGFMNSKSSDEQVTSQEASTNTSLWTRQAGSPVTTEPNEVSSKPKLLRRSTSDTSLFLRKTLSHASSLGDDTRWQNVHEQVNSRFKAIRDSLQDSSLKLPRLPNLSSFSMSSQGDNHGWDSQMPCDLDSSQRNGSIVSNSTIKPIPKPDSSMPPIPHPKHPHLTKALRNLEGDVVILGGYRGSILRSAHPPNRQLWVPIKVGLNIRKVNLEVGLESSTDENMTDAIIPSGMLQHIGPVDISRRLFRHLRHSSNAQAGKLRVWDYGYDWRLNPKFLSDKLIEFLENLPSNSPNTLPGQRGAIVIAHSLGGLVTRHAINRRPELFSGVLYAGTPQTCVNILGPLRNGDDVLLSSRVLTAQVNFTIRTSYALLPLDGKCFFNPETKEEYPVDFFDPKSYEEYCLSPCIARATPSLTDSGGMVGNIVHSMASVLPNISMPRRGSLSSRKSSLRETATSPFSTTPPNTPQKQSIVEPVKKVEREISSDLVHPTTSYKMGMPAGGKEATQNLDSTIATTVTIPKLEAVNYLTRILAEVKQFKEELAYNSLHDEQNLYPPATVIYGKSIPTVYGARVASRDAIKLAGAFDDLAFASGDGVVLARASQLPEGYRLARGGCVSSSRGHVSLLGDLEAVGKCLCAIHRERIRRVREQHVDPEVAQSV